MRKLLPLVLLVGFVAPCFAADIYFGPTATGGNNGADCSNAYAYNDATNGIDGTGTASWVAGNTLHLCGGIWSGSSGQQWVVTKASGAPGNVITIKFETGAILSAPYHSVNGAILIQNSYITIDGGTNGIVQNTTNGTNGSPNCITAPCSTQQPSIFVRINSGSNIELKNLTLSDIYVHDSIYNDNDISGDTTYGLYSLGNSNITVDHNTCHDAKCCFTLWGTSAVISYNTAYNTNWEVGSGIIVPVTGLQINNNLFTQSCAWYTTSGKYHLNNVHLFPNGGTGNYSGVVIYNNHFAGGCLLGAQTAHLFLEGGFTGLQIFNNLFDNQNGGTPYNFPPIWLQSLNAGVTWPITNPLIVNNTFIGSAYATTWDFMYDKGDPGVSGLTFQNNVVTGARTMVAMAITGGGGASNFAANGMNNNAYDATNNGGSGNPFSYNGTAYTTFALYKAGLPVGSGQESASIIEPLATLAINSDGTLQAGSPVIGLGLNLTSLGITALDTGAPQTFGVSGSCGVGCVARPGGGAWDAGAYQFTVTARPNPPHLRVTGVH